MTQKCITCWQDKPEEEFKKVRGKGLAQRCGECRTKVAVTSKKFFESNPSKLADYRLTQRLSSYGLNRETFFEMVDAQEGKCAICDSACELVIDHCHSTGSVRGLLCNECNWGLGLFKDNEETLRKAIEYVRISK